MICQPYQTRGLCYVENKSSRQLTHRRCRAGQAVDDVSGSSAAFGDLADRCTAPLRGATAARYYAPRFAVERVADRLLDVLTVVLATGSPGWPHAAPAPDDKQSSPMSLARRR